MSKFYAKVGYGVPEEASGAEDKGIWIPVTTERSYYADLIRNVRKIQNGRSINDSVSVSNEVSFVADEYAINNFHTIIWVEFQQIKWKVESVEVRHPRLILSLGGVYNG